MASENSPSVSITRATVAAAVATGIIFAACWVGAIIKVTATHMFVALFTSQPIESIAALSNGLPIAIIFGALFGLLASAAYNLVPFGRGS